MLHNTARPLTTRKFGEFPLLIAHYQKSEFTHFKSQIKKSEFANLSTHFALIFLMFLHQFCEKTHATPQQSTISFFSYWLIHTDKC